LSSLVGIGSTMQPASASVADSRIAKRPRRAMATGGGLHWSGSASEGPARVSIIVQPAAAAPDRDVSEFKAQGELEGAMIETRTPPLQQICP